MIGYINRVPFEEVHYKTNNTFTLLNKATVRYPKITHSSAFDLTTQAAATIII